LPRILEGDHPLAAVYDEGDAAARGPNFPEVAGDEVEFYGNADDAANLLAVHVQERCVQPRSTCSREDVDVRPDMGAWFGGGETIPGSGGGIVIVGARLGDCGQRASAVVYEILLAALRGFACFVPATFYKAQVDLVPTLRSVEVAVWLAIADPGEMCVRHQEGQEDLLAGLLVLNVEGALAQHAGDGLLCRARRGEHRAHLAGHAARDLLVDLVGEVRDILARGDRPRNMDRKSGQHDREKGENNDTVAKANFRHAFLPSVKGPVICKMAPEGKSTYINLSSWRSKGATH